MLTLIGDVHQKIPQYLEIIRQYKHTVQLGDLGFRYPRVPEGHWFIPGNHDNYDNLPKYALGDFGNRKILDHEFFFVRGAFSPDHASRTIGIDWWPQEQISGEKADRAIQLYKITRPRIVLSHDAPWTVTQRFHPNKTFTNILLENLYLIHQPDLWVFGHHHRSWTRTIGKTKFVCLNELETYQIH